LRFKVAVHARLDNPLVLRRDILESAIIITDAIRCFERVVELEKHKKEIKKQILNSVKELKKDVKGFEKGIPELPKGMKVTVTRSGVRDAVLEAQRREERESMGGEIKDVEVVRKEVRNIGKKEMKKIRKKLGAAEERERLRRELDSIRTRISKLGRLLPENEELFS